MVPRPATRRRPGIVHQYSNFAEGVVSTVFETLNVVQFTNIRRHGQHVGGAALSDGSDLRSGFFEGIALEIGEANSQPHGSEPLRRREPDPAGSTGHDGDSPFGERGMFSHGHSYLGMGVIYRAGVLRFAATFLRCVKLSSIPSSENSRPMPLRL